LRGLELSHGGVVARLFLVRLKVDHGEVCDLGKIGINVSGDPIEKCPEHLFDNRVRKPRHLGVEVGLERIQSHIENRALNDAIHRLNCTVCRSWGIRHIKGVAGAEALTSAPHDDQLVDDGPEEPEEAEFEFGF
jgi:hypothetical protein